jgi:hypothetical protein
VRTIIREKKWCGLVTIIESEKNKGLANSIIDGVTRIVNEYGKVIVLEDDLVTSRYFLKFMNDALGVYKDAEEVICIHAYVYPVKEPLPETFFLKGADCWGWATWKRGWDLFERDGPGLLNEIQKTKSGYEFDFNGGYPYLKMLKLHIAGKNDSWAVRWYASAFLKNKLTLYPGKSLVKNIGTQGIGTHVNKTTVFDTEVLQTSIPVKPIPLKPNPVAFEAFRKYFLIMKTNVLHRVLVRFKILKSQ